jgi:hypothetical protein
VTDSRSAETKKWKIHLPAISPQRGGTLSGESGYAPHADEKPRDRNAAYMVVRRERHKGNQHVHLFFDFCQL